MITVPSQPKTSPLYLSRRSQKKAGLSNNPSRRSQTKEDPSSAPSTTHHPSILRARRRRPGKITHLARKVRDSINQMLRDGLSYPDIIRKLGRAAKSLNTDNIRRWHAGPFKDWLKHQDWLEQMQARLDFARDVLKDPESGKIREASLCIATKQMYDLLCDFDPAPFIQKLADEPQNYARILNALSKLAEAGLRYDRLHSEVAHRTALRAKNKFDPKTAGLPDHARLQIEDDFHLFDHRRRKAHNSAKRRIKADNGA